MVMSCVRARSDYDLFLVPEKQLQDSVEKLVLVPVTVQADIDPPDSVLILMDSLIEGRLRSAGFSTIPALVYDEIWTRIMQEAGGFYDPYTGRRDEELFTTSVERLKTELQERFDPDALVYPEIWSVEAQNYYGTARWDGVSQSAYMLGEFVEALSLVVVVEDLAGNELYVNGGGLALAEEYASADIGIVRAPADSIFQDPEMVEQAVDLALRPLVRERSR
jgi:hypothetical protein